MMPSSLSSLARLLLSRPLSGPAIPVALRLLETAQAGRLVSQLMQHQMGIAALRELPESCRADLPQTVAPVAARPPRQLPDDHLGPLPASCSGTWPGTWPVSAAALAEAYGRGDTDPSAVLSRLQRGAERLDRHHRRSPVLHLAEGAREDAEAAAAAYREGRPASLLCGVPVAVKEEVAVAGLPVRLGTEFLPDGPAPADATVVARLRRSGAVIAFSAPMTEYGLSPLGVSSRRELPQNPHAHGHAAGGSSTGPAVAVATGLCPLAIGTDGGGSVRIPSALCGVFGLKPTYGRLSRAGDPFGGTMDHLGPIGVSVADLAAFLSITAGPDEADPATFFAPASLPNGPDDLGAQRASWAAALSRGVRDLIIGIDDRLWQRCDPDVAHTCMVAIDRLCQEGARRVAVDLPLSAHAAAIGYLTFCTEVLATLRALRPDPVKVGPDLRLCLRLFAHFPADGYVDAQRLRGGLREEVRTALRAVDLLALPTTATVAPAVSETEMQGMVDPEVMDRLVRFTFVGNLTGIPGLSAPVGSKQIAGGVHLPIGLQLYGDAWDEATVLAAAAHLSRIGAARITRPQVSVDLLAGET